MVKTYYFNSDSISKIKEIVKDFKFVKLSDFITFLNTTKIEDGDKVIINSNLTLDMKEIKHDDNIDFIFDMPVTIKSGYTLTILNANTKDNNIQYFQFIKPLTIYGTLELNHLSCNDSQINIGKKGTLINKSILHNGYGDASESVIINDGKFINERVIHNNSKIINNGEYSHSDYSYIMTHNNKIFDNKGTVKIINGEFINAFKDKEIIKKERQFREETEQEPIIEKVEEEQEEKQEDIKLDDSIDEIKDDDETQDVEQEEVEEIQQQTIEEVINNQLEKIKQEPNLIISTLSESTVKQVVNYGTVYNYGTIEIVNGVFKTSGEFGLTESTFNITGGILEVIDGIIYSSKSNISLTSGTMHLTGGKLELKDSSTLTVLDGEFVMLSSVLNLFDTCSFIVKGGNVDLNNQFNIKGGNIIFDQDKFKSGDRQIILTSRIKGDNTGHDKLNFIIDSETTDNTKIVDDEQYVLKSEFEKQREELLKEKQNEIEKIKKEFFDKMDMKEKQFKKQLELLKKPTTIKDIIDKEITTVVNSSVTDDSTTDKPTTDISTVSISTVPKLATSKFNLSFKYDSDTDNLIPVLVEDTTITEEIDETIESEASELVKEIIHSSETGKEIQKLLSKISSAKYSKIFTKTIELLRQQISTKKTFSFSEREELRQRRLNRTYAKSLNNDNTTSVNKLTTRTTETTKTTSDKIKNIYLNIKNALNKLNSLDTTAYRTQTKTKAESTTKQENTAMQFNRKRKLISDNTHANKVVSIRKKRLV